MNQIANSSIRFAVLCKAVFSVTICLSFSALVPVPAQTGGPYELTWYTIDGGGGVSRGGQYVLTGTIGQPDADWSGPGGLD
jgi:hypothetical protein